MDVINQRMKMNKYYCSECGAWPLKARGLCSKCYDRWRYHNTNRKEQQATWRANNPDYMKNWRAANREHYNAYSREYYQRQFQYDPTE